MKVIEGPSHETHPYPNAHCNGFAKQEAVWSFNDGVQVLKTIKAMRPTFKVLNQRKYV